MRCTTKSSWGSLYGSSTLSDWWTHMESVVATAATASAASSEKRGSSSKEEEAAALHSLVGLKEEAEDPLRNIASRIGQRSIPRPMPPSSIPIICCFSSGKWVVIIEKMTVVLVPAPKPPIACAVIARATKKWTFSTRLIRPRLKS